MRRWTLTVRLEYECVFDCDHGCGLCFDLCYDLCFDPCCDPDCDPDFDLDGKMLFFQEIVDLVREPPFPDVRDCPDVICA